MPRVPTISSRGVRVYGQLRDFQGVPMSKVAISISLARLCVWRGQILATQQRAFTDEDGRFEFWLPPSSELQCVKNPEAEAPDYFISCAGVGSWKFRVPDRVAEYMPAASKERKE